MRFASTRCRTPRRNRLGSKRSQPHPPRTSCPSSPAAATLHGKAPGFMLRLPPQHKPLATFMQPLQEAPRTHPWSSITSLSHHPSSSPLPLVTTTLRNNHFPQLPPFVITTSLSHHFPQSPPFVITTSLSHHFPQSPPFVYVMYCYVMYWYVMYCLVMCCYVMYCYVMYFHITK